jgi:hypothetical protein
MKVHPKTREKVAKIMKKAADEMVQKIVSFF